MKNNSKKILKILFIPSLLLFAILCFSANASAIDSTTLTNKAMLQALVNCYSDSFEANLESINDYSGFDNLIRNAPTSDGANPLPSGLTDINDNDLSCKEVLKGYPGWTQKIDGIFVRLGHPAPASSDKNAASEWLVNYAGYVKVEDNSIPEGTKCVRVILEKEGEQFYTSPICVDEFNENGTINNKPYIIPDDTSIERVIAVENGCSRDQGLFVNDAWTVMAPKVYSSGAEGECTVSDYARFETYGGSTTWDGLIQGVTNLFSDNFAFSHSGYLVPDSGAYSEEVTQQDQQSITASYSASGDSRYYAIDGLYDLGYSRNDRRLVSKVRNAIALTADEKIGLYAYYLTDIYGAVISCSVTNPEVHPEYVAIKWFDGGTTLENPCYIKSSRNTSETVNGVDDERWYVGGTTYNDIVSFFNSLPDGTTTGEPIGTLTPEPDTPVVPDPSGPVDQNGDPLTTDVNCYTSASALGWILCPIVENGRDFVNFIYDSFIEPQLVLNSELFNPSTTGGASTQVAWQTFRDIANIAFIAVFLIVILSQVTGFGIDNYGIKKIMPKLIVTAILVNFSYVICQLAVDTANIVGYGIESIMNNIGAVPEGSQFAITEGGHKLANIGMNLGLGGLVVALAAPAVLGQGVGVLVTVFMALIGIIVAIMTLFFILAVRRAFAICLVVISPLAFLCYMLPNTKVLFRRWSSAFKGTLLAFPICAGLVFGGQAIGRIMMLANESGSFFMTLVSAVTSVAPIFLIPSMLKKSMSMVSGLIDKASNGVNRFAKGRWQGSRIAKSWDREGKMRQSARQSELDYRRAQRTIERAKTKQPRNFAQRRALLNAHSTVASHDKELAQGYAYQMENATPEAATALLSGSISDDNKINFESMAAAVNRIGQLDQGRALEELEKFSNHAGFKSMSDEDRNKFINMLNGLQGNTVAKAWAKTLGSEKKNLSLREAMDNGDIGKQIRGMSKNIIENTDKDVLRFMGGRSWDPGNTAPLASAQLANAFTSEQVANAISSNSISGKQQTAFSQVLSSRNGNQLTEDIQSLTDEQLAVANDSSIYQIAQQIGDDAVRDVLGMRVINIADNDQLSSKLSQTKKDNFFKVRNGNKIITTSADGPIKGPK